MNKRGQMKNKKGISSIIATLILLLLTIVLVGIVWAVVSGIVKTSTEGATSGAQCFNSGVEIKSASCTAAGTCNVTVQRTIGTDVLGGIRLVFINALGESNITDINGTIQTLSSARLTDASMGVANITEIDAAMYFTDSAGTKKVCSGAVEFDAIQMI
jgi:flagellin-like protein